LLFFVVIRGVANYRETLAFGSFMTLKNLKPLELSNASDALAFRDGLFGLLKQAL